MRFSNFAAGLLLLSLATAPAAFAQKKSTTSAHSHSLSPLQEKRKVLRPPAGAKVAIVEFEDLQCPDCGRARPLVEEAQRTYNIPVVHYDFPLPIHNWSFDAAVYLRYFRGQSEKLGDEYRHYVYSNQTAITPQNLREMTQKFAQEHGTALPFVLDPHGKLAAAVKADFALGQRIGIQHTPTLFVVNNNSISGEPFVEVVDRSQLFNLIEQAKETAK